MHNRHATILSLFALAALSTSAVSSWPANMAMPSSRQSPDTQHDFWGVHMNWFLVTSSLSSLESMHLPVLIGCGQLRNSCCISGLCWELAMLSRPFCCRSIHLLRLHLFASSSPLSPLSKEGKEEEWVPAHLSFLPSFLPSFLEYAMRVILVFLPPLAVAPEDTRAFQDMYLLTKVTDTIGLSNSLAEVLYS